MTSITLRHQWRIHILEARGELLRLIRLPMFAIPSLLFPWMFYMFFGVIFNRGNADQASYMLTTYGTFGVIGPALFGFGVAVALDRQRGLLSLKRVLPMPISAYFSAKIFMSMIFAAIIIAGLYAIAVVGANVSLPPQQWSLLALILLIGTLPFCAMGLAIGVWINAQAAPAVVNLLYLPMSFLSGLWIPITMMPGALQKLAFLLPPYHLSQLALGIIGLDQPHAQWIHLLALALFTIIFLLIAGIGYRRISDR